MDKRNIRITTPANIGIILRHLRKESGFTQRDAAGLCNVSLPFLNQLEQGKSTAQIGKVLEVCQRFGIEVIFRLPEEIDGADEVVAEWFSSSLEYSKTDLM